MNLSLFEKIIVIFKYIFSSFLSIEMFISSLLLFCILLFNLKRKNKMVQAIAIVVYIGFLIGVMVTYSTYVQSCIDAFTKSFLNYVYFPSTVVYFFIIVFVTVMLLITVFNEKMTVFEKMINYLIFSILYFFFMAFIVLSSSSGVDLLNVVDLYKNETILSLVQVSNLILVLWFVYIFFFKLYCYFRKKYD